MNLCEFTQDECRTIELDWPALINTASLIGFSGVKSALLLGKKNSNKQYWNEWEHSTNKYTCKSRVKNVIYMGGE